MISNDFTTDPDEVSNSSSGSRSNRGRRVSRRRLLALVGGGVCTATAGCSGSSVSETTTATGTDEDAGTTTDAGTAANRSTDRSPNPARTVAAARQELTDAFALINDFGTVKGDAMTVSPKIAGAYGSEEVASHVEAARSHLATATEKRSVDEQVVQALRHAAELATQLNEQAVGLRVAFTNYDRWRTLFGASEYESAGGSLNDAIDGVRTAGDRIAPIRELLVDIPAPVPALIPSFAPSRYARRQTTLNDTLGSILRIYHGFVRHTAGRFRLTRAFETLDARKYDAAAEAFGVAATVFDEVTEIITRRIASDPTFYRSRVAEITCRSRAFHEGANLYRRATVAYSAGETERGDDLRAEAQAAFESVRDGCP